MSTIRAPHIFLAPHEREIANNPLQFRVETFFGAGKKNKEVHSSFDDCLLAASLTDRPVMIYAEGAITGTLVAARSRLKWRTAEGYNV